MVEHQGDVVEVEYPEYTDDAGEVFDLVVRKGPISLDGIMDQTPMYSRNQVYDWLQRLKNDGFVDSVEGDLHEHGTTATVWYVPKEDNE